ncbi:peptide ABC transporter ATP-binding protein [Methylobacterium indicum]|uniref:ATP-binding cassette domain-containing protein n=1 Tax=Methylobacterium indicum TaxID=1775910 RepID=UPI000734F976|nr:ATP-binding cassette domain-containing protein [Methylobacterium indicum]KTS37364.1 peptide ABC transporter ATP-binding protein [Methylobacterium indicum]KTS40683.1 peptide ABC transporter ATP-binding protein [Methylobacterium indicum]KTS54409.1 peptide ABC transporter ATP-binding protein [Methylobacterium indicum]
MTAPLLSIDNLSRDYALRGAGGAIRSLRAVDGVSLDVAPGSIFAVVGESGCGKSTLARIVMALDRPTGGTVRLGGDDLFALSPKALARKRRDFQMVFQDPYGSLNPRHSVGRIVAEPLHLLDDAPKGRDRNALVARALEDVGLPAQAAERYPHEFSGGQRQRIAIARALITNPKLVVADEAVSALDLSIQAQILRLILSLRDRHGLTVLFITHNIGVVDEIADRVGVMQAGRLVETGTVREVLDHPREDYTRTLLAAEPTLAVLGQRRRRASGAAPGM